MKNVFKFGIIVLLLICLIAVPVFGFRFGGFASPSIFDENDGNTNRQFGGGTSVYLNFAEDQMDNVTEEDYQKAAEILKERFIVRGYNDVETSVVDGLVKVDIARKTFIKALFADAASVGSWSFVGSNLSDVICDGSMIEDAEMVSNNDGSFGVTIHFSEDGAKKFNTNTATYAASSSYIYLMLNGNFAATAQVTGSVEDSFTFGQYDSSNASLLASYMKHGELAAEMVIEKTEDLAPSISKGVQTVIWAACAVLVVAFMVVLFIKGKKAGLFAGAAIIGNIAVIATAVANGYFVFNIATFIAIILCMLLGSFLLLKAVAPFGATNVISAVELKALSKNAVRITWICAAIFALALALLFFTSGTSILIARLLVVFSVAFFANFFAFVFFGVHALADSQK